MRLNLGSGQNRLDDYVNVDKYAICSPDIVHDLETFPWPFEDQSVDEIIMAHVLEHLGQKPEVFLQIMQELYRITKPGAKLKIIVPHPRHEDFLNDPTHVRPITPRMLMLFSKKYNDEVAERGYSDSPLARYLNVDFDVDSVDADLDLRWGKSLKDGTVTQEKLHEAALSMNNVIRQYKIMLTRV